MQSAGWRNEKLPSANNHATATPGTRQARKCIQNGRETFREQQQHAHARMPHLARARSERKVTQQQQGAHHELGVCRGGRGGCRWSRNGRRRAEAHGNQVAEHVAGTIELRAWFESQQGISSRIGGRSSSSRSKTEIAVKAAAAGGTAGGAIKQQQDQQRQKWQK